MWQGVSASEAGAGMGLGVGKMGRPEQSTILEVGSRGNGTSWV